MTLAPTWEPPDVSSPVGVVMVWRVWSLVPHSPPTARHQESLPVVRCTPSIGVKMETPTLRLYVVLELLLKLPVPSQSVNRRVL